MLIHPTLNQMRSLRLHGMARALETQMDSPQARELSFEERLGMLLEAETLERDNQGCSRRLHKAKLRLSATLDDIKYKPGRGLDKSLLISLATCDWLRNKRNLSITGPTGVGKSYLACALANHACKHGFTSLYLRAPLLFDDLTIAKADGRYKKMFRDTVSPKLIILDDFGLSALTADARRDLLEIMEHRYNEASTIITSQFDRDHWHQLIGDPTLADAILDRFVHNAYEIKLTGKTMRGENTKN